MKSVKQFILISLILFKILMPTFAESTPDSSFIQNKTQISARELQNKKEGDYWAVFGGPGYSPDMGFLLALLGGYYSNGFREDSLFSHAPYRHSMFLSASFATKGMRSLRIDWDAPYFSGGPYRIKARVWYSRSPLENYFGSSEASLSKLINPEGVEFNRFNKYMEDLELIENGQTYSYYNYYDESLVLCTLNIERNIFGGSSRVLAGLYCAREWIEDYTNTEVLGTESLGSNSKTEALMRKTKLREDYEQGLINGYSGGWDNSILLGLAYDTRDLETNPREGVFHDITYFLSTKMLGSDFDYSITTLSSRFYHSPLRKYLDLILAIRLCYSFKSGTVPFFNMNYVPTTEKQIYALGGEGNLRGYPQSRFSSKVITYGNIELRSVLKNFQIRDNHLELMLVPFFDIGRVYDKIENTSFRAFKYAYGTGLRFGFNQSFILSIDLGFSEEESAATYFSFGSIF